MDKEILEEIKSIIKAFEDYENGYHEVALFEIEHIDKLLNAYKKQEEVIDRAIDFIENGDLLYLATKNSIVYKDNVEIKAVADRLNDLLQMLEDKEV